MNKKLIFGGLICLLAGPGLLKSQTTKFFVGFKNKNGTPYTISNPNAFLTTKSVNRRMYYNIITDTTDLPVSPSYISQLANVPNVTVIHAIKWLNGVVVAIPGTTAQASALATIASFTFVNNTVPTNRYHLNPLETLAPLANTIIQQESLRAANTQSYNMGGSYWQNQQINVICLHNKGFRGQGITIAVLDVGFNNVDNNPVFDSLRNRQGILGTRDFVSGGTSVYEDPSHGAEVLSCMAAIKPGVIMGSAPLADYWLLRTEDDSSETPTEEYNWIRGAEWADSVGADMLTTSLGYTQFDNSAENHTHATLNGRTAPMSIAATMASRKGLFVLNAAGNEGGNSWQYISVPADADSICTVGAIDSLGVVAGFSSTGPTADGRIKPDLVARGASAWIADVTGVCFPGNGTSFATPILAGGVACFWQANRWLSNMKVLQLLKASGSNAAHPDTLIGWGLPELCTATPLGIAQLSANMVSFRVSPNPFHNSLRLNVNQPGTKVLAIELTDVLGKSVQLMHAPAMTDGDTTINTSALPEGIYVIKLHTIDGVLSKKIVKQ